MSFSNENQLISTPSYTHTLIVKKARLFVIKINLLSFQNDQTFEKIFPLCLGFATKQEKRLRRSKYFTTPILTFDLCSKVLSFFTRCRLSILPTLFSASKSSSRPLSFLFLHRSWSIWLIQASSRPLRSQRRNQSMATWPFATGSAKAPTKILVKNWTCICVIRQRINADFLSYFGIQICDNAWKHRPWICYLIH